MQALPLPAGGHAEPIFAGHVPTKGGGQITTAVCETVLYENISVQPSWYAPGAGSELIDFGTTAGGRVCRITFTYVTTAPTPGVVTIRLYQGTSAFICPGTQLASFAFSGLGGSTDGEAIAYTYTYDLLESEKFDLSPGNFGYGYEFDNSNTGVYLAAGGAGQDNAFWDDCSLIWFGGSPWAGARFRLHAEGASGEHCHNPPNYDLELTPTLAWQTTGATSFQSGGCRIYRLYMDTVHGYDFSLCSNDAVGGQWTGPGDGDLALFNAAGVQLWSIDGRSTCDYDASTLATDYERYVPPVSGYYYLKVKEFLQGSGSYILAYRASRVPPQIRIEPDTLNFDCMSPPAAPAAGAAATATAPVVSPSHPELLNDGGGSTPATRTARLIDEPTVRQAFVNGQARTDVIVMFKAPPRIVTTDFDDARSLADLQVAITERAKAIKARLAPGDLEERRTFRNIPGFSASVTAAGLEKLLADPDVLSVEPVRILRAHLQQGLSLMNATVYRSTYNGAGIAIAICDTGIDYNHPMLGNGGFPNAKVIGGTDVGDHDPNPLDCQGHGTSCAGIAAGDVGISGDYIGGVAPAARLYAVKIVTGCTGSATNDAMIAGWDWCITHKNANPAYPIMVISTSFGGDRYFAYCDGDTAAMTIAARTAVAAGITLVVSSGNDGYCDSMAWPACISSVISVGAVYDAAFGSAAFCVHAASCGPKASYPGCPTGYRADEITAPDRVTAYSNSAAFLDLFAPSHNASTTDIVGSGGYSSGAYTSNFGGTSAACPYVAGAVAALQHAARSIRGTYLTPDEVRTLLASTGDELTDSKAGITKPRVNLGRAIEALADCSQQSLTIYNDGTEPLHVTAVDKPAWLTLVTPPPYVVYGGSSLRVCVTADCNSCAGTPLAANVVVHSNDPDTPSASVPAQLQCPCDHPADMDNDCDVDADDLAIFIDCAAGPAVPYTPVLPAGCTLSPNGLGRIRADIDADDDVDVDDFAILQRCWSGAGTTATLDCLN
ncbi:MAG TPA: S8 family serine peptidase [Phycisphaerae bacterium]|nr:S8 family serine peptidase [Phycisphaerae bacterium]HOJ75156.1 S8 family serine peptidase [Phycisphaerae bacterium]HOM52386.1 S8 family serine peptidase [Phycisphaerae bacterium]HON67225.1 S8 family serine peptidase [Phycisphaerae bacterium]HPP27441.1 S8 family serine peptidase [Phycisphaerae bacterium]